MISKRALNTSKKFVGIHHDFITIVKVLDETDKRNAQMYLCRCDCGKEFKRPSDGLFDIKSCGCMRKKLIGKGNTKHGGSASRLYAVWSGMKSRCYKTDNKRYASYGGRGIKVCEEWKDSFDTFQKWAYENGYDKDADVGECTLDRIDVNGNYAPDNCRWVNMKVQNNNRRDNHLITHEGTTHTLSEWGDITGIDNAVLQNRLKSGWTIERALTEPQRHTIYLEYHGIRKRLTEWAKDIGIHRSVLFRRKAKGWTDEEVIEGRRKNVGA